MRKIFISVIAIGNITRNHRWKILWSQYIQNYQDIQINREKTFNLQNDRWSEDNARRLCLEIIL